MEKDLFYIAEIENIEVIDESYNSDAIVFDNGYKLISYHDQDCCEYHWLDFSELDIDDLKGLKFDLSSDAFFKRVPDYGILLIPTNGHPIPIPAYSSNNGYYSDKLTLILSHIGGDCREYDITECQTDIYN